MEIYKTILDLAAADGPSVLGVVVHAEGSTPQKVGSKALLDGENRQWGTLGGGLVEAEGLDRMRATIASGRMDLFEYRLDASYSREAGPICGGIMRILAIPGPTRYAEAFAKALDAAKTRARGALAVRLSPVNGTEDIVRWIAEGENSALAEAVSGLERATVLKTADGVEYFVEPVVPSPRLLVIGGGHVGQEIVFQASRLDFEVTVLDDRPEFADPALFPPGTAVLSGDIRRHVEAFPQDHETYIVLVSKGHRPDAEALEGCIHGAAKYIGMIGSKRKIRFLRKHFVEDGLATAEEFDRVVAPIGFDIGAVSVPEIGVSIAAQLIAVRRRNSIETKSMRLRSATAAAT